MVPIPEPQPPATSSFQLSDEMFDTAGHVIYGQQVKRVDLDANGVISVDLPATTDPDVNPSGAVYVVTERIGGRPVNTYSIELPYDATEPVDLSTLPPADLNWPDHLRHRGRLCRPHAAATTTVHGIADTSVLATDSDVSTAQSTAESYADSAVSTHSADTTAVHGIADTSVLETQTGAQSKADAAQSAAETFATSTVSTHSADTTAVHGITDTTYLRHPGYTIVALSDAPARVRGPGGLCLRRCQ